MPSHCTRRVLEKLAVGGKQRVALVGAIAVGAAIVGEQMWESDLPIPSQLAGELQGNVGLKLSSGFLRKCQERSFMRKKRTENLKMLMNLV